ATVMPHLVYLHSGLTQRRIVPRSEAEAKRIFRFEIVDVLIAMSLAGIINLAMLYMAASVFHESGFNEVGDIEEAYRTLTPLLGTLAGTVFAVSLLASGLSSSTVGTMAGQVIMQGFVRFTIPVWLRRLVTMLPALVIIALDLDPTRVLVISQVTLSFVLPFPVVSLLLLTARRDLMGGLVNRPLTTALAGACTAIILAL